jgi:hypothetical protein
MAKERFKDIAFRSSSLLIIQQADQIIKEYQARGYTLTLRQLYYQFVSRDLLPNAQKEYKRLGGIVNDARIAGKLDWSAIEDRTRNVKKPSVWDSPEDIIRAVAAQYQEDPWITQPFRPEVWIEKDALVGVIEGVCKRLRVPYFACRGYASQSEIYDAGKRFAETYRGRQRPLVLHLGDHDPSGLDMTRDLGERLTLFAGRDVEVRRLALNMDQIDQYDPPPNPAKDTDARFEGYQEEFGDSSWELDALDPDVISDLIQTELDDVIDLPAWEETTAQEAQNKRALTATYQYWSDVSAYALGLAGDDSNAFEEEDDNDD